VSPARATLMVLAKAPVPGRVKTRLCPPCTPAEAAQLAEAALIDTLHAVADTPAIEPLLVLDGPPGRWIPSGFPTIPQRGDGLDERITAAFVAVGRPALLIGMDTPHVTSNALDEAVGRLVRDGTDAVLGPSEDGGFWALGLRNPAPRLTLGVPMSTVHTGADQVRRLVDEGCHVDTLGPMRDVDTMPDAIAVARRAPTTRFAAAMTELGFAAGALASA
jgi:uncharacterized protein